MNGKIVSKIIPVTITAKVNPVVHHRIVYAYGYSLNYVYGYKEGTAYGFLGNKVTKGVIYVT